jgi:CheY-like chemotaxis protein
VSAQAAANPLAGLRVFVVEDEGPVAMLVEAMLDDLGCALVQSAASIAEALEIVGRGGFDVALLDVNLAGEKVWPVADELRRLGAAFIFTSGYGPGGLRPDFADVPIIQKPYRLGDLEAALAARVMYSGKHHPPDTGEFLTMSDLKPAPLSRSVKLAGSELTCSCHACAFFSSDDEEQAVLAPFARDSLSANDRLVQIINNRHREDRAHRLRAEGIDVEAATASGQLDMRPWEGAYLSGDRGFDQDAMLALIQELLREGRSRGFGMTRLWANMEWALEDLPGVDQIVEYETRLNHVLPKYDDVVVCTYDLNKFSAATVMDILRTHPQVIVGGVLQQNPFFIPPDQFLAELHARKRSA